MGGRGPRWRLAANRLDMFHGVASPHCVGRDAMLTQATLWISGASTSNSTDTTRDRGEQAIDVTLANGSYPAPRLILPVETSSRKPPASIRSNSSCHSRLETAASSSRLALEPRHDGGRSRRYRFRRPAAALDGTRRGGPRRQPETSFPPACGRMTACDLCPRLRLVAHL